jgi:hypothetical protein
VNQNNKAWRKRMASEIMIKTHGDMLYGDEGQFRTKEGVIKSYRWKEMDQDINDFLKKF